jgi:hypothetical protein
MHECCCMEKIKINKREMENERNILRLHGFHLRSIISAPYKLANQIDLANGSKATHITGTR